MLQHVIRNGQARQTDRPLLGSTPLVTVQAVASDSRPACGDLPSYAARKTALSRRAARPILHPSARTSRGGKRLPCAA